MTTQPTPAELEAANEIINADSQYERQHNPAGLRDHFARIIAAHHEQRELFSDLAAQVPRQPCGHPVACIISTGEGTHHCSWCASEHKWDVVRAAKAWADAYAAHGAAIGNNQPETVTGPLCIALLRCNLDLYTAITHRR